MSHLQLRVVTINAHLSYLEATLSRRGGYRSCTSCTEDCQIVRLEFSCRQSVTCLQKSDIHFLITSSFSTHYKKLLGLVILCCITVVCAQDDCEEGNKTTL